MGVDRVVIRPSIPALDLQRKIAPRKAYFMLHGTAHVRVGSLVGKSVGEGELQKKVIVASFFHPFLLSTPKIWADPNLYLSVHYRDFLGLSISLLDESGGANN